MAFFDKSWPLRASPRPFDSIFPFKSCRRRRPLRLRLSVITSAPTIFTRHQIAALSALPFVATSATKARFRSLEATSRNRLIATAPHQSQKALRAFSFSCLCSNPILTVCNLEFYTPQPIFGSGLRARCHVMGNYSGRMTDANADYRARSALILAASRRTRFQ